MDVFSLSHKIIQSFQDLSDLSDLLVMEDGLGFIEKLLLNIGLCWLT